MRNEDMISELPEALLLQILSCIPTEDAFATSVLSRRWRSLCKMIPSLRFWYRGNGLERFSDNVCRCLLSHQAPVLQSLHLEMNFEKGSTMDIGVIMGMAFGLRVRELELELYSDSDERYRFPTSLYNCGTLETLKLSSDVLVDVPFLVCLKSLTTLCLEGVRFQDDESVVNLLSGCSILETLEVTRHSHSDVKTFTIDVPSLQRLILTSFNEEIGCFSSYVINAPSLKHLEIIRVMEDDSSCLIENTPELLLVEAHLNVCGVIYENIHKSLTSVKRLSLIVSPLDPTKFPTNIIFKQLVFLELRTCEPEWWDLFILMLHSSPNLQVLKLLSDWVRDGDHVAYKRWTQPRYVPECLLNCLETLIWNNYEGDIGDEKEVAHYILRNASRLKTATFSRRDIHPEKNLEMFKEMASVVRASNSCQLVFKEADLTWRSFKLFALLGL